MFFPNSYGGYKWLQNLLSYRQKPGQPQKMPTKIKLEITQSSESKGK